MMTQVRLFWPLRVAGVAPNPITVLLEQAAEAEAVLGQSVLHLTVQVLAATSLLASSWVPRTPDMWMLTVA